MADTCSVPAFNKGIYLSFLPQYDIVEMGTCFDIWIYLWRWPLKHSHSSRAPSPNLLWPSWTQGRKRYSVTSQCTRSTPLGSVHKSTAISLNTMHLRCSDSLPQNMITVNQSAAQTSCCQCCCKRPPLSSSANSAPDTVLLNNNVLRLFHDMSNLSDEN